MIQVQVLCHQASSKSNTKREKKSLGLCLVVVGLKLMPLSNGSRGFVRGGLGLVSALDGLGIGLGKLSKKLSLRGNGVGF